MHTDGYVVGGTDAIVSTFFGNAQDPMFERDSNGNPGCFMHRQASFIPGFWPEEAKAGLGTETTFFAFPQMDVVSDTVLGAGDMWAVLVNDEATQRVVEFMLSDDYWTGVAENWSGSSSTRITAHTGFDTSKYWSPVVAQQAEFLKAALQANVFRFDGSDNMPTEVGSGSFWVEMTELATQGPGYIDTALDNIEKSWP